MKTDIDMRNSLVYPKSRSFSINKKLPNHLYNKIKNPNHSLDITEYDAQLKHKNFLYGKYGKTASFDTQLKRPDFLKQFGTSSSILKEPKDTALNPEKVRAYAESMAKSSQGIVREMQRYKITKVEKNVLDDGISSFRSEIKDLHKIAKPKLYKLNDDVLKEYKELLSIK